MKGSLVAIGLMVSSTYAEIFSMWQDLDSSIYSWSDLHFVELCLPLIVCRKLYLGVDVKLRLHNRLHLGLLWLFLYLRFLKRYFCSLIVVLKLSFLRKLNWILILAPLCCSTSSLIVSIKVSGKFSAGGSNRIYLYYIEFIDCC